jgi:ferredoxin, 2Fe-2S
MAKITYIQHDGTHHVLEVETGFSVMEGAVKKGIAGIDADCGGSCACGTCHVYVDGDWVDRIPPPSAAEEGMLEYVSLPNARSRLSCQIVVSPDLDGLIVQLPESQG